MNSFVALPDKGGHRGLMPPPGGGMRNFIVMVQRGCGQLVNILLIGWL